MSTLELRLLGGFEIWWDGRPLEGFESKNARVLLAYLATTEPGARQSRNRLAGLFWPDAPEEAGRQNLRQALYNLRSTLRPVEERVGGPLLVSDRQSVGFAADHPAARIDVLEFRRCLFANGSGPGPLDTTRTIAAVQLYRGDFLAGLFVDSGLELEHWLLSQQERLREDVLSAIRVLVAHFSEHQEFAQAVMFARRHLEIDPLSEEMHRQLMRLYALSGRRGRALAQYEQCLNLLRMEFGVEPLEETTAVYESILADEVTRSGVRRDPDPACPRIPLVGRRAPYELLKQSFERARAEGARLALVVGESGLGKTRFVKAFVHDSTSMCPARVALGRSGIGDCCAEYGYLRSLATSAHLHAVDEADQEREDSVAPGPGCSRAGSPPALEPCPTFELPGAGDIVTQVGRCFASYSRPRDSALILLCDDLSHADEASLNAMPRLVETLENAPAWVVITARPDELVPGSPLSHLLEWGRAQNRLDVVHLDRITAADLLQVSASFLGSPQDRALGGYLAERTGGFPLAIVEWINLLCEKGAIECVEGREWRFSPERAKSVIEPGWTIEAVIAERLAHLTDSTRRLLSLSAVAGHQFSTEILQLALHEDDVVIANGLETLLRHWWIRHAPRNWFASRRERDIVLWSQGVRTGRFEFAHRIVRRVVYHSIGPFRRRHLHALIAGALETLGPDHADVSLENLVLHRIYADQRSAAEKTADEWLRLRTGTRPSRTRVRRLLEDADLFIQKSSLTGGAVAVSDGPP